MTEKAFSLACCIIRAAIASGVSENAFPPPENEIYWHTREACLPIARAEGILWADVVRKITEASSLTVVLEPGRLNVFSDQYWYEVAHPEVIVREVMTT